MRTHHPSLEDLKIEGLRRAAVLALDQGSTQGIQLSRAHLFTTYQVQDVLCVVDVVPRLKLGRDPAVLLVGMRDGLAHGGHEALLLDTRSSLLMRNAEGRCHYGSTNAVDRMNEELVA